jgi:plasmid stability protein
MKNITITLDEAIAAWASIRAAKHNMSVSRLVGEMLRERMIGLRERRAA